MSNELSELDEINDAAFRYARRLGLSPSEAGQVAGHVVKRARQATEYAVTRGGTAPERWYR